MEEKYERCENPQIIKTNIPCTKEYLTFIANSVSTEDNIGVVREIKTYALLMHKLAIVVPCGHCQYCRHKIALLWSSRINLECDNPVGYKAKLFLTLTFRDRTQQVEEDKWTNITSHDDHKLIYENIKRFIKNLRKKGLMHKEDKYFCVGEYGGIKQGKETSAHRFHYHIILLLKDDSVIESVTLEEVNEYRTKYMADEYTGKGRFMRKKTLYELKAEYLVYKAWNAKRQIQTGKFKLGTELSTEYDKPDDCIVFVSCVGDGGETAWYVSCYCTCAEYEKEDYRPYHHQSKGFGEWYAKLHRSEIYAGTMRAYKDPRGYYHPLPRTWRQKYGNIWKERINFLDLYPQTCEQWINTYNLDPFSQEMIKYYGITTAFEPIYNLVRKRTDSVKWKEVLFHQAQDNEIYKGHRPLRLSEYTLLNLSKRPKNLGFIGIAEEAHSVGNKTDQCK